MSTSPSPSAVKHRHLVATRLATRSMDRTTRGLPDEERSRHRDEVIAEMYSLSPLAALRYAFGVMGTSAAMRAALTDGEPLAEESQGRSPLGCRTNLHHVWKGFSTEDGGRYRACARCGKDDPHLGNAQPPLFF
ncbi:hypothetical protein N865_09545 [Intrasporangium oryzae NRRL B-24470]|uniref:Uncharacterized protein n=1 Tax=Intrasporangium oryzae NRRL B-24470 TaxID=1386089 RepID=W9GEM5_9MICO|nr:hypothetical protein [Intrasporangium oryzae]EWT03672.1 hypothetical protein N865_09545 [Intrasporangium oryzae NRRL B-24470]